MLNRISYKDIYTAQGTQLKIYNNYKWSIIFNSCEYLCCTCETHGKSTIPQLKKLGCHKKLAAKMKTENLSWILLSKYPFDKELCVYFYYCMTAVY